MKRKRMPGCRCCEPCPGGPLFLFSRCGEPVDAAYSLATLEGRTVASGDTGPSGTVVIAVALGETYAMTFSSGGDGPFTIDFRAACANGFDFDEFLSRACCVNGGLPASVACACGGTAFSLVNSGGDVWAGGGAVPVNGMSAVYVPPGFVDGSCSCGDIEPGGMSVEVVLRCDDPERSATITAGWWAAECFFEPSYALDSPCEQYSPLSPNMQMEIVYVQLSQAVTIAAGALTSPITVTVPPVPGYPPWPGGVVTLSW